MAEILLTSNKKILFSNNFENIIQQPYWIEMIRVKVVWSLGASIESILKIAIRAKSRFEIAYEVEKRGVDYQKDLQ